MADNLKPALSDQDFKQMQATFAGLKSQILWQRSRRARDTEDMFHPQSREMLADLEGGLADDEDGWIVQAEAALAEMARNLPELAGFDEAARQALYEEAADAMFWIDQEFRLGEAHPEFALDPAERAEKDTWLTQYRAAMAVGDSWKKADEGIVQLLLRLEAPKELLA